MPEGVPGAQALAGLAGCFEGGTPMNSAFTPRLARDEDIAALNVLMAAAIRGLLRDFLSPQAVEASFDVMGLDT